MTYLVVAYDYPHAYDRRLQYREAHIQQAKKRMKEGSILKAGALMEAGNMIGSSLIVNFSSKEELETWLETEPYIQGEVWDKSRLTITPIKLLD